MNSTLKKGFFMYLPFTFSIRSLKKKKKNMKPISK